MGTILLGLFLAAHGLVHLAIWLPRPEPDPAKPPPFPPGHSAVLELTTTSESTVRRVSVALASAAAASYLVAAIVVLAGASWAGEVAAVAATLGIALKVLYFHPWLSLGVAIDCAVLASATVGWPLTI